jgi:hypothetical protein
MKLKNHERGQALVLIALAAVGLFAFTALAIDGSRVFSDYRHAQNAADTSALAAALSKVRANPPTNGPIDAEIAGKARAGSNGFDDTNSIVEVHVCSEPNLDPPCTGLPTGADPSEYLQVVIRSATKTTFTRVIGRTEIPFTVSAIARAAPGGPETKGRGYAISAMNEHDPKTINGHGNFTLEVRNSGVFNNSDDPCAMYFSGSAGIYSVATEFGIAPNGWHCESGFPQLIGDIKSAEKQKYPPDMNVLIPDIKCTGTSIYDPVNHTYSPGNHNNLSIPSGTVTFAPGNHCFNGGVSVTGNTNIIAYNTNFLVSSGDFNIGSNGSFKCNNMLVHINGGTGFHINGNSVNICQGVTFIASTGDVKWNGNAETNLIAPTWGPYKGLLIYLPYGNTSPLVINGNSDVNVAGSIIAVSSPVTVSGNTNGKFGGAFDLNSEIIGNTVELAGNGNIVIDYDPDKMYQEIAPTEIKMTK